MIRTIIFIQLHIFAIIAGALFGIFLFKITHFNYFVKDNGDKRIYDKNMDKDLIDYLCNKKGFKKVSYLRYLTFKSNKEK